MDRTERVWYVVLVVVVGLVGISVLGIGSCIRYERRQEVACQRAGGQLYTVGGPNGNGSGCYRVTLESITPVPVP